MLVFTRLLDHAASGFRDVIQFPSSSPALGSLSRIPSLSRSGPRGHIIAVRRPRRRRCCTLRDRER